MLPIVICIGQSEWISNRTIVEMLGEPKVFHPYSPQWSPIFWILTETLPEKLLAADNAWLHMLTVLQVEHEETDRFRDLFVKCAQQFKIISKEEGTRWYDLIRIVFTWSAWRRPNEKDVELPTLLKSEFPNAEHQYEFDEMIAKHSGPSLTELAREDGREEGRIRSLGSQSRIVQSAIESTIC